MKTEPIFEYRPDPNSKSLTATAGDISQGLVYLEKNSLNVRQQPDIPYNFTYIMFLLGTQPFNENFDIFFPFFLSLYCCFWWE